jgi:hypothetical protein
MCDAQAGAPRVSCVSPIRLYATDTCFADIGIDAIGIIRGVCQHDSVIDSIFECADRNLFVFIDAIARSNFEISATFQGVASDYRRNRTDRCCRERETQSRRLPSR